MTLEHKNRFSPVELRTEKWVKSNLNLEQKKRFSPGVFRTEEQI